MSASLFFHQKSSPLSFLYLLYWLTVLSHNVQQDLPYFASRGIFVFFLIAFLDTVEASYCCCLIQRDGSRTYTNYCDNSKTKRVCRDNGLYYNSGFWISSVMAVIGEIPTQKLHTYENSNLISWRDAVEETLTNIGGDCIDHIII